MPIRVQPDTAALIACCRLSASFQPGLGQQPAAAVLTRQGLLPSIISIACSWTASLHSSVSSAQSLSQHQSHHQQQQQQQQPQAHSKSPAVAALPDACRCSLQQQPWPPGSIQRAASYPAAAGATSGAILHYVQAVRNRGPHTYQHSSSYSSISRGVSLNTDDVRPAQDPRQWAASDNEGADKLSQRPLATSITKLTSRDWQGSSGSSSSGAKPIFPNSLGSPDNSSSSSSSQHDSGEGGSSDSGAGGAGGRGKLLSSMLAAAAERLESSAAAAAGVGSSSLSAHVDSSVGAHQTYLLPAVQTDQQQQQMFAKATSIIERLRARGYSAFIVGGWVRDVYLQRRPADIDIATSAPPARVKQIFAGDQMVDLPRSTVKLLHQGEAFELSFFKGVSKVSSLFSLGMDAVCRDFTINALYYDPATNQVLDFVGGVDDARSRTLRLNQDDARRLSEDPLRVLRAVRFATGLGLKLSPGTAAALRQHAHVCSLSAGVPPRRIWLELVKLAKAEAAQPGSWPHALKLSYHLGLLPHLFPWLQHQQSGKASKASKSSSAVPDPFGHGVSTLRGSSRGSSSMDGSSSSSRNDSSSSKAVLVAERLSKFWHDQQQQGKQQTGGVLWPTGGLPLPLMVAALVHPSVESYATAEPYLRQLFPDAQEWDVIKTLMDAAQLAKGQMYNTTNRSSDSSQASQSAAASDTPCWSRIYAHPAAAGCLAVLACWMPDALATSFMRFHMARMAAGSRDPLQALPTSRAKNGPTKRVKSDLSAALAALGVGRCTADSLQRNGVGGL